MVVLELEEVGSKELQLERPESEVACEVVVEPTAKCQAKSACVLLVSNIPAFARATPYRTCAEGVVRPIGRTKQGPKR